VLVPVVKYLGTIVATKGIPMRQESQDFFHGGFVAIFL
jgi:hypothetical protein